VKIRSADLKVARVLHTDADFVTLEVGRHHGVTFHLQQDDEGVTVGGDTFYTLLFVRADGDGGMEVWDPLASAPDAGSADGEGEQP